MGIRDGNVMRLVMITVMTAMVMNMMIMVLES